MKNRYTVERIKHLSEIMYYTIISIGILIGGGWTLYSYVENMEKDKSNLIKLQRDIADKINLGINISLSEILGEDKIIKIESILENSGTETQYLEFIEQPLSIYKVDFDKNGAPKLLNEKKYSIRSGNEIIYKKNIYPNETKKYIFAIKVDTWGLYYVNFKVIYKINSKTSSSFFQGSEYIYIGNKDLK